MENLKHKNPSLYEGQTKKKQFQGERIINTLLHVRDLQAKGDENYITTIPIHETNTHPLMWCLLKPWFPSKFIITSFRHDGAHFVPQPSFTQELFSEDGVPKETIRIEQPQVNVINLLDDYVESPRGLDIIHLFSTSLMFQAHVL